MIWLKAWVTTYAAAILLAAAAACTTTTAQVSPPNALTVLAGSEVKDIEPLLPDLRTATGVDVQLAYSGTIEGVDRIEHDTANPDCVWFAQDRYFQLVDDKHRIKSSEKIMISPVVLGVKESKARELGWRNGVTTWKDVEKAVAAGKFSYAMTSPTTSNSGFSAVIGITTAFSGSGDAARTRDVDARRLTAFFSGQKLLAGSSGWLADAYVRDEPHIDGMINYESVILSLAGRVKEPLRVIAPGDGTVIADYPFVLINPDKKGAYDKVVAWLRSPPTQARIMQETHRRPVNPAVKLSAELTTGTLIDTPFPASRKTIDAMLIAYLNKHRIPAHTFYVLDKTGSMSSMDGTDESRIARTKDALYVLTGADSSLTGQFAKFDDREDVTVITFDERPEIDRTFSMHRADDRDVFTGVRQIADGLRPDGGTAIYDALERALDEADSDPPGRYDSIVLMTDGENNRGEGADAFVDHYQRRKKQVRIFAIGIGESEPGELGRIAEMTGGRYFDGRKENLSDIFKDVRGYQ